MSVCEELINGVDYSCGITQGSFVQRVMLINMEDVKQYLIHSNDEHNTIRFSLKQGKRAIEFAYPQNTDSVSGSYSKTQDDNLVYYSQEISLYLKGVTENEKAIDKQLDHSDFFAALQYSDGTVLIYGFFNGLKTNNYTHKQESVKTIRTIYDEVDPPYVYKSVSGQNDFDNRFENLPDVIDGDYDEDDYDKDYWIGIN